MKKSRKEKLLIYIVEKLLPGKTIYKKKSKKEVKNAS
ncbi:hypothetical protein LCGC14_1376870 [marine sediment metagenome]|uniref:Uncharacterized protein n=1 Tax=marine sediment metagenome TaxID=412755 RepID=A0A0F9K3S8_9ZZZZ